MKTLTVTDEDFDIIRASVSSRYNALEDRMVYLLQKPVKATAEHIKDGEALIEKYKVLLEKIDRIGGQR